MILSQKIGDFMIRTHTHGASFHGRHQLPNATDPRAMRDAGLKGETHPRTTIRVGERVPEDRVSLRISSLERRMDRTEMTLKIGAIALVALGLSVAAYQNWTEIQGAASTAWSKVPNGDAVRNEVVARWAQFKGFLGFAP